MESAAAQAANAWSGRRCLVTGAGGFIGGALCRRLHAAGAEVWGLGRHDAPPPAVDHWQRCDMTDLPALRRVLGQARPQRIFHLASTVQGARSLELVLPTLQDNLLSFVHLALSAGQSCERVVTLGSLQEPDQALPAVPGSPYAAAKYAASCYARLFHEAFGLQVSIARTFMVYGPGQRDAGKLVPFLLARLLHHRAAELSSGAQGFDWVYVDDVAEALMAIAAEPDAVGCTLDVGTGRLTTVADVARRIGSALGVPELLRFGALPDRRGEPTRVADTQTTLRCTGWRAGVDLDAGLAMTIEHFRRVHAQAAPCRP